jgi:predicted GNAT superfamily acetyltransferase
MLEEAERDAVTAANRADVEVRAVGSVAGLRESAALFARIWDAPEVAPVPHDLLRSLVHAGGSVHGAYRGDRLVGAAAAVFGPPSTHSCYSLITGVDPGAESRGIGLALKLAQRVWALTAGAQSMRWTYDPLLRRNAGFNLRKLGAVATEYLIDFYGEIADGVNDSETDRLAVSWDLTATMPARRQAAPVPGEPVPGGSVPGGTGTRAPSAVTSAVLLAEAADGSPVAGEPLPHAGGPGEARCWIPPDMLALRRRDPEMARRWRLAVRESLGGALGRGWLVDGFAEPGWYVLRRQEGGQ